MERGSPENSASSSLEQSKQNPVVPDFLTSRQTEKRPRSENTDEQTSYLALLTGAESPEAEVGTSSPTIENDLDFEAQQINVQMRPMVVDPQSTTNLYCDINLATNGSGSRPLTGSTLKRKTISKDETSLNPNNNIRNLLGDDQIQGFNSSSTQGYSVYDERYLAHGLPVDPHLRMFNAIYGNGNAGFS